MAAKIETSTFDFLKSLKENNTKEWFLDNKSKFEIAKTNFEDFVAELIAEISSFDPNVGHLEVKKCVFRIYRDVRFSKDKSPYKTNFGAHINPKSTKTDVHSTSGYYIHLEPSATMLAGGAYLPQADWLKSIRQEIDYNGQELLEILNNKDFKNILENLKAINSAECLKDMPKITHLLSS